MKKYTKENPEVILQIRKLMIYEMKVTGNSNNFPKKYRHNIVDDILRSTYRMIRMARKAYDDYDKNHKARYIEEAAAECNVIKDILPCVLEVLHPSCSIDYWNKLLDETLKQLETWKKSLL